MAKKRKQIPVKEFAPESYQPITADHYPTENEEFEGYYRSDTALGDQYVMEEYDKQEHPWDEEKDKEELKDKAFLGETQDY